MIYFLDTSALVKRYVTELGSAQVRGLFARHRRVAVARLTYAEVIAACARRARQGALSPRLHQSILDKFEGDFASFTVVELRQATMKVIPALCSQHPLRAYDAVQLASALTLRGAVAAVDFWTTDVVLRRAALTEGLRATAVEP